VAAAALKALADDGALAAPEVAAALRKLEIDPEKPEPWRL
jgi:pyruvate dehydrogenase complex dehydrogenase (E1) component